ncbi:MAG: hypothetical protein DI552_00530 [Brevundimonas sp.]|uniref:hypothetical protein n=1 Tax=Brevundimonas sp. TaxID=1871086 RepID=UPI000DBBF693|nr:hypothetical protein [Brevundimonas sp.]PZU62222.1 MAG: hypothetical protein DI552_00530 [Brevundimonas sp.]
MAYPALHRLSTVGLALGLVEPPFFIHPFVGYAFTGGGGLWGANWIQSAMGGGEGCGGAGGGLDNTGAPQGGGPGGVFGGGGGACSAAGSTAVGGPGGLLAPGRYIAGGYGGARARAGGGGGGYARGEFGVVPGTNLPITVASAAAGAAAGLVIIEY